MAERKTFDAVKDDVATIPNYLTAVRLLMIPLLYRAVKRDPAANWWKAGLMAASDNIDGWLARQEDKRPHLANKGFRRSEIGRIGDPVVDTIFGASMLHAGMEGGAIPKPLGMAGLAQKAAKTVISLTAAGRKKELHVSSTGKIGEGATVVGFGLRMGAEAIDNPTLRSAARTGADIVAATGIVMSTIAAIGYARDAELLPEEPTALEDRVERFAEQLVHLPRNIADVLQPEN